MYEIIFLFVLGFIWIMSAVVQDMRTREIANWLTYSLIIFALAYRAFYSILSNNLSFFVLGLGGVIFFTALAYLLYYGRAFAGGDAKLLIGLGGILPFTSIMDYLYIGLGFIFVLFLTGSLYSLCYTFFPVQGQWKQFRPYFVKQLGKQKLFVIFSALIGVCFWILFVLFEIDYGWILFLLVTSLPFLYVYARSVEQCCMIKKWPASRLTEGDWLEREVKVRGRTFKPSVHGLSLSDIQFLQKAKAKVWIKEGIPFSPAFLLAFVIMVYVSLT